MEASMDATQLSESVKCTELLSGRTSFMGIDMGFLLMNDIQMFTLYEILEKIILGIPRSTVLARLDKLKASRHVCSRKEVQMLKDIGGIRACAVHSTLIARKYIEEYCEKYNLNEANIRSSCLQNIPSEQCKSSSVSEIPENVEQGLINSEHAFRNTETYKGTGQVEVLVPIGKESNNTQFYTQKDESKHTEISQQSSSCFEDTAKDVENPTNNISSTVTEQTSDCYKKQDENFIHRRKRRTNLEILELYNDEIAHVFQSGKRQRKISQRMENSNNQETELKIRASFSRKRSLTSPDIKNKQFSIEIKKEAENESKSEDLDQNNNNGEWSPTFLFKRSVNNEWRIASSTLPLLDFDNTEDAFDYPNNSSVNKTGTIALKNSLCEGSEPVKTGGEGQCGKVRTFSRNNNASEPLEKPKDKPTVLRMNASDVNTLKNQSDNFTDENAIKSSGVVNNTNMLLNKAKYGKTSKPHTPTKEELTSASCYRTITQKLSQGNEEERKPKRRRRIQPNMFRLVETIPYSSLLMVKDGDLCPADTMIYGSNKCDPGCCHALWRWRVGKPVSPAKPVSASKATKLSPEKQQSGCSCETECPVATEKDNETFCLENQIDIQNDNQQQFN